MEAMANQAMHGLDVVGDDLGTGLNHLLQVVHHTLEVGNQNLDLGLRREATGLQDAVGEVSRSRIFDVISVHGGDDDVVEVHLGNGRGQVMGLERVQRSGIFGSLDGAEPAAARTGVSHDHERGGSATPALTDVWTPSFFADSVQSVLLNKTLNILNLRDFS